MGAGPRGFRCLSITLLVVGIAGLEVARASHAHAVDEPVATKIKTPKGMIDEVALARNPDNGDILAVYESDGRIYATVLKETVGGKFNGRKAKPISGQGRIHHRPAAIWNAERGAWAVAWDTAPADFAGAWAEHTSGGKRLSPSQIRTRELNARNGKARGPEGIFDDGSLNVGPRFLLRGETPPARSPASGQVLLVHTSSGTGTALDSGWFWVLARRFTDFLLGSPEPPLAGRIPDSQGRAALFEPFLKNVQGTDPASASTGGFISPTHLVDDTGGLDAAIVGIDLTGFPERIEVVLGNTTPQRLRDFMSSGCPTYVSAAFLLWCTQGRVRGEGIDENLASAAPFGISGPGQRTFSLPVDPWAPDFVPASKFFLAEHRLRFRLRDAGSEARIHGIERNGGFDDGRLLFRARKGLLAIEGISHVGGERRVLVLWAEKANNKRSRLTLQSLELSDG